MASIFIMNKVERGFRSAAGLENLFMVALLLFWQSSVYIMIEQYRSCLFVMANHGNNKEEKMGRLWMIAFVAVLCTYLFFRWLPPLEPFSPTLFLTQLLFSPFRTWLAFACFLLGVAANGALLSIAVTGTVRLLSGRRLRLGQWLLSLAALGHFYWAFQFHWRLAALFFRFFLFLWYDDDERPPVDQR